MEDILGFLFIIIMAVVSAANKKNKKKQQEVGRKAAREAIAAKGPKMVSPAESASLADAAAAGAAALHDSAAHEMTARPGSIAEATHEGLHPCDEHSDAPAEAAQPSVQPAMHLDQSTTPVRGSLNEDTHEGLHPCGEHERGMTRSDSLLGEEPEEESGIRLDWSGDSMVKAFIMQEVLTRPCMRKRA